MEGFLEQVREVYQKADAELLKQEIEKVKAEILKRASSGFNHVTINTEVRVRNYLTNNGFDVNARGGGGWIVRW